jgi:hypothetical protein
MHDFKPVPPFGRLALAAADITTVARVGQTSSSPPPGTLGPDAGPSYAEPGGTPTTGQLTDPEKRPLLVAGSDAVGLSPADRSDARRTAGPS